MPHSSSPFGPRPRLLDFRRTALVLIALLFTVPASCSSGPDTVSRRDCERLRDHLVDLRMGSVTADRDQHRAALLAALGDDFITTCVARTSPERLHCALDADDATHLRTCTDR